MKPLAPFRMVGEPSYAGRPLGAGRRSFSTVLALVVLLLLSSGTALADDEIHWLGEDRYLVRYRARDIKNLAKVLSTARDKSAALCEIAGKQAYSLDEQELRERVSVQNQEIALDIVLLDVVPEEAPADRVVRACSRSASNKTIAAMRKAMRKAGITSLRSP